MMKNQFPPLYTKSRVWAREHGEIEQWRNSVKENMYCKAAIERSIGKYFDGFHLDKKAIQEVVEDYGAERTAFVLANTVQLKSYDGRFSKANLRWAESIPVPDEESEGLGRWDYIVESHSAVLDGFIDDFRHQYEQTEVKKNMMKNHQQSM